MLNLRQVAILIVILFVIVFLFTILFLGIYFFNFAIKRKKEGESAIEIDESNERIDRDMAQAMEWWERAKKQKLEMRSKDRLRLVGTYFPARSLTKDTVVLCHGYGGKREAMAEYVHFYHDFFNINVFVPDARAYGDSQGQYIGMGWLDRKDIVDWCKLLIKKFGKDINLVLHGVSMGGAAVSMASGEASLPKNVLCIVSDCAYASVRGLFAYLIHRLFNMPVFLVETVASVVCKCKAGYFFREADTAKQVAKSKTPILFIHGSGDRFVPTHMASELYECATCKKEIYIVEGAKHALSFKADSKEYFRRIGDFMSKCRKKEDL